MSRIATYNCKPTLTDYQVLEFCKKGYIMLDGVIAPETNQRVVDWIDKWQMDGPKLPDHPGHDKVDSLLDEQWFQQEVLRNPQGAGVMRSLLGANYVEPTWLSWYGGGEPGPPGQWHVDGGSRFNRRLQVLKWFYYPVDIPESVGPTEFVTGSHHVVNQVRFMAHYDAIRGIWKSSAPAGSIFITAYRLWHRRARSWGKDTRCMLTSSVWRRTPPTRDWIISKDFDFVTADYDLPEPRFGEQNRSAPDTAELFYWLCGKADEYQTVGGPAWPLPRTNVNRRYGAPDHLQ